MYWYVARNKSWVTEEEMERRVWWWRRKRGPLGGDRIKVKELNRIRKVTMICRRQNCVEREERRERRRID